MKRTIRLTESDLHSMIAEAVKVALNEIGDSARGQYWLGQFAAAQKHDNTGRYDYHDYEHTKQYANNAAKGGEFEHQFDKNFAGNSPFIHGYNDRNDLNAAQELNNRKNTPKTNRKLTNMQDEIANNSQMYSNKPHQFNPKSSNWQ